MSRKAVADLEVPVPDGEQRPPEGPESPPEQGGRRSFNDYIAAIPHEVLVDKFGEFIDHGLSANAKAWMAQRPHEPLVPILELIV